LEFSKTAGEKAGCTAGKKCDILKQTKLKEKLQKSGADASLFPVFGLRAEYAEKRDNAAAVRSAVPESGR